MLPDGPYNPKEHEEKIYQLWESSGYFNPDNLPVSAEAPVFSVAMPPVNVTGVLHLGHALENSLMDIEIRYQRMTGKKAVIVPGTDHAAVATQAKVEKELIKSGKYKNPRAELGREKLLEIIKEYAENSQTTILSQIKKMGTSCDWSRLAYTFDEQREKAVNTMFFKMYHDGLIYRGFRVVNWSVKGQSTLSDDELVYQEQIGKLYYFKYSADFPIPIATTRPETKLGDTAVAVNPHDERYKKYIGQTFIVDVGAKNPLSIKIIGDEMVDPEYGTGALGVTPAHSQIDFELKEKYDLALVQVIDQYGRMTENAGKNYVGLKVLAAREKFIAWLKENNLFIKEEDIPQNIGTSDRFGDVVEALPMLQWFVAVNKKIPGQDKSLKDLMRDAVTIGHQGDLKQKIEIVPERFEKIYLHWIDNLRDWCISRQIWFGHQIPVYYKRVISKKQSRVLGTISNEIKNKKSKNLIDITYFVHGTTIDNEQNKCTGWNEGVLSDLGKKQNTALKETLKKIGDVYDIVFTSDLTRAKQSAQVVFEDYKIIADQRLRECNYGDLNGVSESKFKNEEYYIDNPHLNGESYKDVEKRMRDFLMEVEKKYAGKKIAIVAHKAPQFALEVIINNKSWQQVINEDWRKKKAWQPGWKYRIENCCEEEIFVGEKAPDDSWEQDPDTLDTWFSSGLWTFSTLGWPEKTDDLKKFHPTSWMQMGYEILFFWMARMILMSTYALNEIPFYKVYIHGMLRDKQGKKFSKSLGTGIDPRDMCDKYGTDALRMSLISGVTPGNDSKFQEDKIIGFQRFANKIWNASKFVLNNLGDDFTPSPKLALQGLPLVKGESLNHDDQNILESLKKNIESVTKNLDEFMFHEAAQEIYQFFWHDFCDVYLEAVKKRLTGANENDQNLARQILYTVLLTSLKLLHPFMPFITEIIYQQLPVKKESTLMIDRWPIVNLK